MIWRVGANGWRVEKSANQAVSALFAHQLPPKGAKAMKTTKHVLLVLLLTASSGAWAEWIPVSGAGELTAYINPATIRRSDDRVKMWGLYDFKSAKPFGKRQYLSMKAQSEYDCKDERSRNIFSTMTAGNMGGGETVYVSDGVPGNWTPNVPGSVGETLWKIACGVYGSNHQEKTEARFDSAIKF